uniref:Uncharacterized protein n=1 Tax=Rhizophagus irregularis (strain DAOM 181602 / DAOM 197198 / MUCL 43194) TaxID=747089 RepID=U9TYS3_RHIID
MYIRTFNDFLLEFEGLELEELLPIKINLLTLEGLELEELEDSNNFQSFNALHCMREAMIGHLVLLAVDFQREINRMGHKFLIIFQIYARSFIKLWEKLVTSGYQTYKLSFNAQILELSIKK